MENNKDASEESCARGFELLSRRHYKHALQDFETAIKLDSKNKKAWQGKGDALYGLKRYEDALEAYERLIELTRDDTRPWEWDYREDAYRFERKCKTDPGTIEAQRCKENTLYALQRHADLLAAWNAIWKKESVYLWIKDNRSQWRKKAEDFYSRELYKEALQVYDEIIQLDPDDESAWHYKGDVLYLLNRYDEALKAYDGAIALGPEYEDLPKLEKVAFDDDEKYDAYLYREYVAHPRHGKANALYSLKRIKEASAVWDIAIRFGLYEEKGQNTGELIESFKAGLHRQKPY